MVIGVDVGSSGTRAVAVDPHGVEVATARVRRAPARSEGRSFLGLAPAAIRDEVLSAVRSATAKLRPEQVRAISLACFRQTLIVHDDGEVRAAFGNDAAVDAAWVRDDVPLAASLAEPRLRWLAHTLPAALGQPGLTVATLPGWLAGSLTGGYAEEPTSASTTGLLDPVSGAWTDRAGALAADLGLTLPPMAPCGHVVGSLRADVASSLGLPSVPVAVAGGDAQAAAYVARLAAPDATVLSCGTHWQQLTPSGAIGGDGGAAVRVTSSHQPGEVYQETLIYYPGETFTAVDSGSSATATGDVAGRPRLNTQVFFRSTLERSVPIDRARPVVTWSSPPEHDWLAELPLAVMVGASLTLEHVVRRVHDRGASARPLVVVGGAARSSDWLSAITAALGRPIMALPGVEAASLGAALIGWQAVRSGRDDDVVTPALALSTPADDPVGRLVTTSRKEWRSARELLRHWDINDGVEWS